MPWRVVVSFVADLGQQQISQQHELAFGGCH
jgi:hypothetical protein